MRYFNCGSSVLSMSCLNAFASDHCYLWSPAGKGLTSWLSFEMFNCFFVTFPCGILCQVWYLMDHFLIFTPFLLRDCKGPCIAAVCDYCISWSYSLFVSPAHARHIRIMISSSSVESYFWLRLITFEWMHEFYSKFTEG